MYTVSQDGALFRWEYVSRLDENGDTTESFEGKDTARWRIVKRDYFLQNNAKVKCASYHPSSNLLVVGFSNGIFGLYELPEFNMIHTLSISQTDIDFVTINKSGEWLAFGASKLGQLLVWEWQSESYILKQQSHFDSINALTYSPDGQQVITTADDGKIKVWDIRSGFCIVTFTEHSGAVTACEFSKRGKVLFTSSLDGSVRAWDLIRYRNFRTFTAPTRLPFSCLAVDPTGEVVCAGSLDSFDIHIWSVQTGQLLDQLAGHEGPVSSLAFAATGGIVVSGSWDHTVRIWDIFARTQTSESLVLQSDVLDVAIRPDSKQLAVSTLDGQLTFWSISSGSQESGLSGRRDVSGGRLLSDRRTAANAAGSKAFHSIAYSIDGSCILAGGNSKYVCLYSISSLTLLRKYTISINLSLEGTQEFLNSRYLTEAGPVGLLDTQGEASDLEDRIDRTLPGATKGGDLSLRKTRPQVRVTALGFSPTARSFCAASTEGLLIYSLDNMIQFDPFDLDISITPTSILTTLDQKSYLLALVMAFRLNEAPYIRSVYENIPPSSITLTVQSLPVVYLARLLRFIAQIAEESPHLEFNLLWIEAVLSLHGAYLRDNRGMFEAELRGVQKVVQRVRGELGRVGEENGYVVDYLLGQEAPEDAKEGEMDIAMVMDDTNGKGEVGGTIVVRDDGEDEEDEWIGLD
jgi:periodic tryptophan protein 2